MKRLFSSLIIFGCMNFYSLLGMDKVSLISANHSKKIHKTIDSVTDLKQNLEEELNLRKSSSTSKDTKTKRKLQKKVSITRPFLEKLKNQQGQNILVIKDLMESYQLFENFMGQLTEPNCYPIELQKKDSILLTGMYNALHSMFQTNPFSQDLTRSTLCINTVQSSSMALAALQKQKSDLEKQRNQIEDQLASVGTQLEFESLRHNFAKIELQKQTTTKAKQVAAEQQEMLALQKQIDQLTLEFQNKKQQVEITGTKHLQMQALLEEDFLKI